MAGEGAAAEVAGEKPSAGPEGAPAGPEKPKPPTPEQLAAAKKQFDDYVEIVLGTAIRGMNASNPMIPAEVLMRSVMRVTGKLIAAAILPAPLQTVLSARRQLRDDIKAGMESVPIVEPKAPARSMVREPVK